MRSTTAHSAEEQRQPELTDAQLVTDARAGKQHAFDRLLQRYLTRAQNVAMRLLSHRADAEEAVQEAMLRAIRRLDTLQDPARFGPWLMRIVANVALNHRRARRRAMRRMWSLDHTDTETGLTVGQSVPAPDHHPVHPESLAMANELDERIQSKLAELTDRQRSALLMFSVEGRPQREVANLLGCSVEAVKWHVFEARRRLRTSLNGLLHS